MQNVNEILKKYEEGFAPGRKSPEQYAQMRKDADIIRSAANKRLARLEKYETKTGIQSGAYDRAKELGMFNNGNRFTTKVDDKQLPKLINDMRRFMGWETSTVKGTKKVMVSDKREQLRKMSGTSKNWARKHLDLDFMRDYWAGYNKMKEDPAIMALLQTEKYTSGTLLEEYQKVVFSDLDAFRKNPDKAMQKAKEALNNIRLSYEEEQEEEEETIKKWVDISEVFGD